MNIGSVLTHSLKSARYLTCLAIFATTSLIMSPAQMPNSATGIVHTDQIDLGYEVLGGSNVALPLFVVNGGPGLDRRYMTVKGVWEPIAKKRPVVFYDQRGTGDSKSTNPTLPITMDTEISDLDAIRIKLGYDKIALLGHSWGGMVAMAYTAAHPEHVQQLILCDSVSAKWSEMHGKAGVYYNFFPELGENDRVAKEKVSKDLDAVDRTDALDQLQTMFVSPEKRDLYLQQMKNWDVEPYVDRALEESTANIDLRAAISKFHLPVLVVTGRFDTTIEPIVSWQLAREIPGAKLVFLEKSGHFSFFEEAEKFDQVLQEFLR